MLGRFDRPVFHRAVRGFPAFLVDKRPVGLADVAEQHPGAVHMDRDLTRLMDEFTKTDEIKVLLAQRPIDQEPDASHRDISRPRLAQGVVLAVVAPGTKLDLDPEMKPPVPPAFLLLLFALFQAHDQLADRLTQRDIDMGVRP